MHTRTLHALTQESSMREKHANRAILTVKEQIFQTETRAKLLFLFSSFREPTAFHYAKRHIYMQS